MHSVLKNVLGLFLVFMGLLGCTGSVEQKPIPQAQPTEEGGVINETLVQTKLPTQRPNLYVKAISGLRLRKDPDPSSLFLTIVPFGTAIQPLDSISEGQFVVDGQSGRMIQVKYYGQQGFVFDGFVTQGAIPQTRPLNDGKYCFESLGTPGYNYLAFTVAGNRIIHGFGDGHTAYEEESWTTSFEGVFEETGKILVRMVVENSSGRQKPRLET